MKNIVFMIVCVTVLVACNPTIQTNPTMPVETPLLKSKAMGYFQAAGINPEWSLEISEERIHFKSGEMEMQTPHVEPIRVADANIKTYRAFVEKGEITISIYQKECSMMNSRETFSYEVKIQLKTTEQTNEFTGCGNYVADYRLYDLWVLEELEGKKISATNFLNEIPNLEINASNKTLSGYAGCNRITGTLFQERELLRFTNISSTRMDCPSGNLEHTFLKALQSSTRYEIRDNRLFLSNPSGMKIIFRKVD